MTPEERRVLQEVLQLTEQNHKMLRQLRRSMVVSRIITIFYWILIIGITFGSYYVIRPYLGPIGKLFDNVSQISNYSSLTHF